MRYKLVIIFLIGILYACEVETTLEANQTLNSNTDEIAINQIQVAANGFLFDCRVSGNSEDEMIMLLHGFPQNSFMWVDLMKELTSKGYYCVAPNLRGYSRGARPNGINKYKLDKLSIDVLEIAKELGKDEFHLVAHDWGAGIGWQLAADHPDNVLTYSALSIPHLSAFAESLILDPCQVPYLVYTILLQIPIFPELFMALNDYELTRNTLTESSEEEINEYISILKQQNATTAAVNYYRANSNFNGLSNIGRINVPTLLIWGKDDFAICASGIQNTEDYIDADYTLVELDAGHWLIETEMEIIRDKILEHIE